jgi:hypothetical protein
MESDPGQLCETFAMRVLAAGTMVAYACLISVLSYLHRDSLLELSYDERVCAGVVACVMLGAYAVNVSSLGTGEFAGPRQVMVAVHIVPFTANALAAFTPMPVLVDPFTLVRAHQSRYAEWTVLAFTMTYMIESSDSTSFVQPMIVGLRSAVGVLIAGIIIPNLRGYPFLWAFGLVFVYANFLTVFPRVWARMEAVRADQKDMRAADVEARLKRGLANDLLVTCSCMWSLFAASYMLVGLCAWRAGDSWAHPRWPYIVDGTMDVLVKLLYGLAIERAHSSIPKRRAQIQGELIKNALDVMCAPRNRAAAAALAARTCCNPSPSPPPPRARASPSQITRSALASPAGGTAPT